MTKRHDMMNHAGRASRWPAWLDLTQSLTGLVLALFMWGHMAFVSSILISHDAFWVVAKFFEGYFFLGYGIPQVVSLVVLAIWLLVIVHAALAMRKFPANWAQYRTVWQHSKLLKHEDTWLWLVQLVTGFGLFFLASIHLYDMFVEPELIDPYGSSDLVWSGRRWPMLALLLICVEIHGSVGLYRLALKWGWPSFGSPERTRKILKKIMWFLIVFLIGVGLITLSTFMRIGYDHAPNRGELYTPSFIQHDVDGNKDGGHAQ